MTFRSREGMDLLVQGPSRRCTPSFPLFEDGDDSKFYPFSPPRSPRRCDRGQQVPRRNVAASMKSRSTSHDDLFLYCTEELGSESTSGAGHISGSHASDLSANELYTMPLQSSYPPSASAKMQTLQLPVSFATGEPVDRAIIATVASANPSASPAVPSLSQHTVRDRAVTRAGLRRSRRNVFPPPLPSLLYDRPVLKSFKSGGRFLLKKVTAASQSLFRSTRKDGRLRLELIASPSCEDPEDHCLAQSGGPANSVPRTVSSITLRPGRHLLPPHRHCYISTPYPSKWSCDQKSLYPQALADLVRSDTTHGCPLLHIPKSHQHAFSSSSSPTQCLTSSMSVVESPVQKEIETALSRHTGTISTPRFFAFVNLFSLGLGLIILEFVQVKRGVAFALQGVHMIKSLGLPCGMNWISPTDHLLSNASSTADAEMPIPQLAIPL